MAGNDGRKGLTEGDVGSTGEERTVGIFEAAEMEARIPSRRAFAVDLSVHLVCNSTRFCLCQVLY